MFAIIPNINDPLTEIRFFLNVYAVNNCTRCQELYRPLLLLKA